MTQQVHVLSVGSREESDQVSDILLTHKNVGITAALNGMDIAMAHHLEHAVDLVILHPSLSSRQLKRVAEYMRRHWPLARILLVHANAEILDDPLYDERVSPSTLQNGLIFSIDQAAKAQSKSLHNAENAQHSVDIRSRSRSVR